MRYRLADAWDGPPRVVLYSRVSSRWQKINNQALRLAGYALQRGWRVVAEFQETGSAWQHKPELLKACRVARRAKCRVLIESPDRVLRHRDYKKLKTAPSKTAWRKFHRKYRAKFLVLFDRDIRSEQIKRGLRKQNSPAVDQPTKQELQEQAKQLAAENHPVRTIANMLEISKSTVQRWLNSTPKKIKPPKGLTGILPISEIMRVCNCSRRTAYRKVAKFELETNQGQNSENREALNSRNRKTQEAQVLKNLAHREIQKSRNPRSSEFKVLL